MRKIFWMVAIFLYDLKFFFLIYILFYHISIKIYWGRNGLGKNYIWKGDSIVCVRICACVCLIERLEEREKEFSFLVFSLGHLFDRNLWTIKLMATLSNILVYFGLKCIEPQNENSKKCFEDVHLSLKTCCLSYVKLRSKKKLFKNSFSPLLSK